MRAPDLGEAGLRAVWRVNDAVLIAQGPKDWQATLGRWVLECHGDIAMCAWHFWALTLIHLRPIEGGQPAELFYKGAGFQLGSIAIHAKEGNPLEKIERNEPVSPLIPIDFAIQFHGLDDAGALRAVEHCLQKVAAGLLSPDRDYRLRWEALLSDQGAKFSPSFRVDQVGHA